MSLKGKTIESQRENVEPQRKKPLSLKGKSIESQRRQTLNLKDGPVGSSRRGTPFKLQTKQLSLDNGAGLGQRWGREDHNLLATVCRQQRKLSKTMGVKKMRGVCPTEKVIKNKLISLFDENSARSLVLA